MSYLRFPHPVRTIPITIQHFPLQIPELFIYICIYVCVCVNEDETNKRYEETHINNNNERLSRADRPLLLASSLL